MPWILLHSEACTQNLPFCLRRHNERVQAVIPKKKLLVFKVKQGWKPFSFGCGFQGKNFLGGIRINRWLGKISKTPARISRQCYRHSCHVIRSSQLILLLQVLICPPLKPFFFLNKRDSCDYAFELKKLVTCRNG